MLQIAPSILAADFANLQRDVESAEQAGADLLHVDVMDGVFVPNISFGIPVVQALRRVTRLPLDVHLMIDRPGRYVTEFAKAGADLITVHLEADQPQNILAALGEIKALGKQAGVALKPKTPATAILPYLSNLDLALVMMVEPGFGGQAFMTDQLEKLETVRAMLDQDVPECMLEVDGGIDPATAKQCAAAGATVLVAGSSLFGAENRGLRIRQLRGFV